MFLGFSFFSNFKKKEETKRKNPKLKEIKCEKLNIWILDIYKIHIEIGSLYNIFNKLDIDQKTSLSYLTTDVIDLDPYRLPYIKFFRLRQIENKKMKQSNLTHLKNFVNHVEKKLGLKNQNKIKKIWVEKENVDHQIEEFIRNKFTDNYDIKMFLLKFFNHHSRKYKLIIEKNKKDIIIEEGIKHLRPNKKILKTLKGYIVNVKGKRINVSKSSIGLILSLSHIRENNIIKHITYFTKHIKQNYEITIKYFKITYPKKVKKELYWINDKPEYSEKIKREDISIFDNLIMNAENYYNMLIEDENRRLRDIGLIPYKRSKSGDYSEKRREIYQKLWGSSNRESDEEEEDEDEEFYESSESETEEIEEKKIEKNEKREKKK